MRIENPAAFSFIIHEEIYLLNQDKIAYRESAAPVPIPETILETPKLNFNYLGRHKKKFLIIVHYPGIEFMADNHLTALESTLKRLGFSLDDVAIFNLAANPGASFEQLSHFFSPDVLLVLGQQALAPGIDGLSLNTRAKIDNCVALFTYSFNDMMDNTENKKAFWEQMKQLQ